ncbi:MAG: epimerase [Candidatus Kapaibacterium sp.]
MKVVITGSTGMVGKAVLLESIDDTRVTDILLINRSPLGISHPKVKEVIHKDFMDFSPIQEQLNGYDLCCHCMGVSSAGMSEEQYSKLTFGISESLANILYSSNPNMVFNYVSGTGTDGTEKGSTMWARVKGKTENMILQKGFKDAYMFRPGVILPERGIKSKTSLYNIFYVIARPLFPLLRKVKSITTTTKIGKAMINTYYYPQSLKHLEGANINELASRKN